MTGSDGNLNAALARLEARWGSAAIRLGNGARIGTPGTGRVLVEGALAPVLEPHESHAPHPLSPLPADVVSTGFTALDGILGTGGLPRGASVAVRGGASSGKTTLALRTAGETQAAGSIVAWLDLTEAFDPLEAAARGIDLRWLVVVRSPDPVEGLRLAGALLSGRAIDLLVVDLPPRLPAAREGLLRRLAAHARRIGARLLVLEPVGLTSALGGTLAEVSGIRLELERDGWIRVGRDVVGQRTAVTVAKNRYGPPGRRVQLEIRYAEEGDRGPGVMRRLDTRVPPARVAPAPPLRLLEPEDIDRPIHDATAAPLLDSPAASIRARSPRLPDRSRRRRRATMGPGDRPRLQPGGAPAGRASGATAGIGP
jgi:hypothetical protein